MNRVVTIILVAVPMSTMLTAQQAAPTFEIASVRPNVSDTPPSMTVPSQGTVAITNAPSIFTVLREQLGLKPESTRAPVEVLVIDSVERPTPD